MKWLSILQFGDSMRLLHSSAVSLHTFLDDITRAHSLVQLNTAYDFHLCSQFRIRAMKGHS